MLWPRTEVLVGENSTRSKESNGTLPGSTLALAGLEAIAPVIQSPSGFSSIVPGSRDEVLFIRSSAHPSTEAAS